MRILASVAFAVLGVLASAAACRAACGPSDPTGYFEGTARSKEAGELRVSLNLRCDAGRYAGELVTPVGTFGVHDGSASGMQVTLQFGGGAIGQNGTIVLMVARDEASGTFTLGADAGPLALRRTGEARAAAPVAPVLDLPKAAWHDDLRFFASTLATHHVDPFRYTPRAAFDASVAALDARIDALDADTIYVGMNAIANAIGDGHTYVEFPPDHAQLPFAVRRFGGDFRVGAVTGEARPALGARLLKIGDVPVRAAYETLYRTMTPIAETPDLRALRAQGFLALGMALHGAGIIGDRTHADFTFARDDGSTFALTLRALPADAAPAWTNVWKTTPLARTHPGEDFWYEYLPASRTVYCNFRTYRNLARNAAGLLAFLREKKPDRLALDLRQNGGGDFAEGLRYVIDPIAKMPAINRKGHLFVLIGTATFSAAMSNAAQFRTRAHALLVGQTIGERPNSAQEANETHLPNSHLLLRYSTRHYAFLPGHDAVVPDKRIEPSWAEYAAGSDPALEWVLARR